MSAWYVLNALGLFPLCPGHPSYVLTSPVFPHATITLSDGKTLHIDAPDTSDTHVYANHVTWNGKALTALHIDHAALASGGRLALTMAERPTPRALADNDLPYSLSPYPAAEPDADLFASTIRIDCGGLGDGGAWVGDCFFEGGESETVTSPAWDSIHQSARVGTDFRYRIPLPMLPGDRAYVVRLHVTEAAPTGNVTINGVKVQSNQTAIAEFLRVLPNHDGAIEFVFTNTKISGIEVLPEK